MNILDITSLPKLNLSEEHKELLAGYKALCTVKERAYANKLTLGICDSFSKSYKNAYLYVFDQNCLHKYAPEFQRIMGELALELGTEKSYPVPAPKWFYESAKVYLNGVEIKQGKVIKKNSVVSVHYIDENGADGQILLNSFTDTVNQIIEHAAYKVLPKWTGDYGALRLEFLDKLIAYYVEEIKTKIMDKYVHPTTY